MGAFATALRPLRHYADFGGRSTRTELLLFYLLLGIVEVPVVGLGALAIGYRASHWTEVALSLALLCPGAALAVRRLHDVGFSGWWLLPTAPLVAWNLWELVERTGDPFLMPPDPPLALAIPVGLYWLALTVLLLWDDDLNVNRYGPNPRYDSPGESG
jgi:uncharacterized membrane protein YhaH (DUF805 family)